jgi:hypothetical protein
VALWCGWAVAVLFHPEDGFLDVALSRGGIGVLGSDDVETRLLEDFERGDVVAGRAGVQRPGGYQVEQEFQGLGGDSASPGRTIDPVGDLGLIPDTKLAMLPASCPSQVMARIVMSGELLTLAI